MIPSTFVALLMFLGLVAPGLVHRLVREKRRSKRNDSAFVEASRVAVTSLVFSAATFALLWAAQAAGLLPLPDVGAWLGQGTRYAAANFGKVGFGIAAQVAVACLLAAGAARYATRGSTSRFRDDTVYGAVFRHYAPAGFSPWVHARLDDGTEFWGYERAHDDRDGARSRIVLAGQTLMRRLPGETERRQIGENWDVVVLEADKIRYLQVIYINDADQQVRAAA
jgi:hypothetical protein